MTISDYAAFVLSPTSHHQHVVPDSTVLPGSDQSKSNPVVVQARRSWVTSTASGARTLILDIAGAGQIECVLSLRATEELRQCLEEMRAASFRTRQSPLERAPADCADAAMHARLHARKDYFGHPLRACHWGSSRKQSQVRQREAQARAWPRR